MDDPEYCCDCLRPVELKDMVNVSESGPTYFVCQHCARDYELDED